MKCSVVCGMGEIGQALAEVLSGNYDLYVKDAGGEFSRYKDFMFDQVAVSGGLPEVDVLHICFPYSETFIADVQTYIGYVDPDVTVIHSTVPIGTSRACNALHSPVIGRHPHLAESIRTMTKFIGGSFASDVADYFRRAGIEVYLTDKQESTELSKILCTTSLGVYVEWTKDIKRQCDKYGVPFELWTIWTNEYNDGYERLNMSTVHRPNLVPIQTKISGHCVLPNLKFIESKFVDLIEEMNDV